MNVDRALLLLLYVFTLFSLTGSTTAASTSSAGRPASRLEIPHDWQFRRIGSADWRPADVPGCVHTDLVASGQIEDPFYRDNEKSLQWIEGTGWEYRTWFDVGPAMLQNQHIDICFEGLDTYADVYLNGVRLLTADNMFRRWTVECRKLLVASGNLLQVYLFSPVESVRARWDSLGYELPGGPRVFTRKAAYHYGWDWGPRLVTMGIWRPIHLEGWDEAIIRDIRIATGKVTDQQAAVTAVFEIEADRTESVDLSLTHLAGLDRPAKTTAVLEPGLNQVGLPLVIDSPALWWTNGLGPANLYDFTGELRIGGVAVSTKSGQFGLRTLELVTERDDEGETFYFKLNGVPVFMKGANYIPQDNFLPRVSPERYRALIRDVREANMNMLRVWGGGIYEDDTFYDQCDKNGILVWQDFMFACALYPGDPSFLDNVRQEAVQNVRRLRNHPCIALWCGNNEIAEAWFNWGWQKQFHYSPADSIHLWEDYECLFHRLLPGIVAEYDGDRPYWPSSPRFGRGDPRSLSEGDSHYWGVWHDAEPFQMFNIKIGRFMSEYGFQSFPDVKTIASFTRPEDRTVDAPVMLSHQKHPRGNQLIQTYMERDYRTPKNFEQFVYVGQLLQAEGIITAIEAHRRARPRCMGTLYWQLNDCWPVVSWSSRDYYGRWKALQYFVRKAYAEVLVSPILAEGGLQVYVISDLLEPAVGELSLRLLDFQGNVIWQREISRLIHPGASDLWWETRPDELPAGFDTARSVLAAVISTGKTRLSENLLYFVPPRELELPLVSIRRQIHSIEHGYSIVLSSDGLVKNLCLSIQDAAGSFSDNYFDLLPGDPVEVFFLTTGEAVDNFEQRLRITSLLDSFTADP